MDEEKKEMKNINKINQKVNSEASKENLFNKSNENNFSFSEINKENDIRRKKNYLETETKFNKVHKYKKIFKEKSENNIKADVNNKFYIKNKKELRNEFNSNYLQNKNKSIRVHTDIEARKGERDRYRDRDRERVGIYYSDNMEFRSELGEKLKNSEEINYNNNFTDIIINKDYHIIKKNYIYKNKNIIIKENFNEIYNNLKSKDKRNSKTKKNLNLEYNKIHKNINNNSNSINNNNINNQLSKNNSYAYIDTNSNINTNNKKINSSSKIKLGDKWKLLNINDIISEKVLLSNKMGNKYTILYYKINYK